MSETRFTPGPWRVAQLEGDDYLSVVADINAHEANLIARPGHPIREVHEANVRLIAAAPDLLAVSERLLILAEGVESWLAAGVDLGFTPEGRGLVHSLITEARVALARAKGEAP
jgi:hypothetical protein